MKNVADSSDRPSDPSKISFEARCFEQVGEAVEFVIPMASGGMGGPKVFTDRAAADKAASRIGRPYEERTRPIMRRISWT